MTTEHNLSDQPNGPKNVFFTPPFLARIFFILAGLGVGLGAFGAHALKDIRSAHQIEIWKTATFYLLIHALAGAVLSLLSEQRTLPRSSLLLFLVGSVLFAGSLYALVLTQISLLGAVTPFGGLMFIAGWINLAFRMR